MKSQRRSLSRAALTKRQALTHNESEDLKGHFLCHLYRARQLGKRGPSGRPHKYSSDSITIDMMVRPEGRAQRRVIWA